MGGVKTMVSLFVGAEGTRPHPTDPRNAVLLEEGLTALSALMGVDVAKVRPSFALFCCC